MITILYIAIGILGLIVGSFLNVVIYRYNTGKGIGGRSECLACQKQLSWYELLPLVSFIAQRGRCRGCGAHFSWQYMMVELLTGIGFVLIAWRFIDVVLSVNSIPALIFGFIIVALCMVIAVYDIRHFIMPDAFVITFIVLSLVQLFVPILTDPAASWLALPSWWGILSGIIIPLPFALLWLASKGRLLGFGDVKFMIGIGWLLGLTMGITAVVFAFWIGTLWVIMVYTGHHVRKLLPGTGLVSHASRRIIGKEIPFAPFLIIATLLVFITQFDLVAYLIYF